MRPFRREAFSCASRTRREQLIRPKISRIDFELTELEHFKVWSARPKPVVDFHTEARARGAAVDEGRFPAEVARAADGGERRGGRAVPHGPRAQESVDGPRAVELGRVDEEVDGRVREGGHVRGRLDAEVVVRAQVHEDGVGRGREVEGARRRVRVEGGPVTRWSARPRRRAAPRARGRRRRRRSRSGGRW